MEPHTHNEEKVRIEGEVLEAVKKPISAHMEAQHIAGLNRFVEHVHSHFTKIGEVLNTDGTLEDLAKEIAALCGEAEQINQVVSLVLMKTLMGGIFEMSEMIFEDVAKYTGEEEPEKEEAQV